MKKPYFGRLIPAMVTPFNEDGSINYTEYTAFGQWLLDNGCDALLVEGSTGEPATFTEAEKLELIRVACEAFAGKTPIIVGAGTNCTAGTIEYIKKLEQFPIDGLLVVGPYYNKPTQEGFYQHFSAIAKATKLPIIVYNVPGRTGSNIAPATVARLAKDHANIVAIKEAAGNVAQCAELYSVLPEDFTIYSGDDGLILPFMSVGAQGLISVTANIAPAMFKELMETFMAGDIAKAAELNKKATKLANAMFIESNPIPVKAAVTKVTPFNAGAPRLPLTPISAAAEEKMDAVLKELGLLK